MKRLIIMGAGGFGREVLQWARDAGYHAGDWRIAGFIDDDPEALAKYQAVEFPILGGTSDYSPADQDYLVCALGLPKVKRDCVERLKARGSRFATLVHPSAVIGQRVTLGEGCVVCPGVIVTADVVIGDFVILNCQSTVGHDARIGDWTTLSGHCDVTGFAELGEGVFMGSHASVIPRVRVGEWSVIGAGSVVVRRVPPGVTVVGVPATPLGT